MFGSQALETAIGLVLMFFIIALGTSSLTEAISRLASKRAKNLENSIKSMLGVDKGTDDLDEDALKRHTTQIEAKKDTLAQEKHKLPPLIEKLEELRRTIGPFEPNELDNDEQCKEKEPNRATLQCLEQQIAQQRQAISEARTALSTTLTENPWEWFAGTTIYDSAKNAAGQAFTLGRKTKSPSYLSAKGFADAAVEMVTVANEIDLSLLPGQLGKRADALRVEARDDLLAVKAGLERWFDDNMERLEGAYKRWVTSILFGLGLVIAVTANASTFHVAQRLWQEPITRQAVVAAADSIVVTQSEPDATADEGNTGITPEPLAVDDLASVAATTDKLSEVGLPVGWDDNATKTWPDWKIWEGWGNDYADDRLAYLGGWLLTALLVTLGAPFWFDLLTRLSSLRGTGRKPEPATKDTASSSSLLKASIEAQS